MATEARKAEERKRPINRLQSMYALRALVDKQYQEAQTAKEEGRPVAWCMVESFAGPIFNAIGIDSVYPENFGPACAADKSGVGKDYLERCGAEGFPDHLCGYIRIALGYAAMMADLGGETPPGAPQGGMPKPVFLLSSGMSCDARFKGFQALGRYLDAPQWTLEVPHTSAMESLMEGAYERDVNFLVKELREFVAFLEHLLGKKIDWDKLGEDLDQTMEMNAIWWEINELRKARPGPMHARDFWSSVASSLLRTTNPQAVKELYRKLYDEVKYRIDNKISGINYEEKYRMSFDGLPPWHSLGFFDQLAERGWNFVIETAYHPPRPIDLSMVSDPLERLVRYRSQSLAHRIDTEFEPEEAVKVKEEIKRTGFSAKLAIKNTIDYQLDGVFLHPLLTCRLATAGLLLRQSQYLEEAKVPCLVIEGDIVDVDLFNPVEAMRKAEAFEETMDYYREERKKIGLRW